MENKYGKWYSSTQECKDKVKNSCLEHFGVPYNFQSEDTKNKSRQTCFEKYGVYNSFQAQSTKEKYMKNMMAKYGAPWPANVPSLHKKMLSHFGMTIPEKKMNEFLFNRHLNFQYSYDCNGKNFDFAIFDDQNTLKILVEIDGEFFHGLTSDYDGNHCRGEHDCERFEKVPDNVKFIVCDSSNVEKCFNEILKVFNNDLFYSIYRI
mgnify:CR=1 FL=1